MVRLVCISFLIGAAMAQTPPPAQAPAAQGGRAARPTPPTRDPHTQGYVDAKELPDGAVPSPKENGNFIIGPTHNPAPEMTTPEDAPKGNIIEFVMKSEDSKIYPGIARDPNTATRPDPNDPTRPQISTHPQPYTRRVNVYVPK